MMLKISLVIVAAYCCIAAVQGAAIDAEDRICPYVREINYKMLLLNGRYDIGLFIIINGK